MEKAIHEMSLIELHITMEEAISKNYDQRLVNILAKELAYRYYVPFGEKTFEQMLVEYGYRIIEKGKDNIK